MQIKNFLLLGMLCTYVIFTKAQSPATAISGTLKNSVGEAIASATIKLQNTYQGSTSDHNGFFRISNVKPGTYIVLVNAMGFAPQKKQITVTDSQELKLNFVLTESSQDMEMVNVIGRTVTQESNRQAYNVTAIDAKKLHNTTLDISQVLDKVSGIRVRESGGVGSNVNLSLNGFSGKQVKFFIDGIPMDNFGSSFQINNIPVNLADRIEVYKGVVPVSLGADALGGAINIITNNKLNNYVDASYSFGSFNTHRTTINTGFTLKSGFTVQINAFQNYSDNNYRVYVPIVVDQESRKTQMGWVNRFHDRYHNETLIANVGVVNKKYADRLLLGVTLGQNKADVQTGARMFDVYGDRFRKGNVLMPSLKYNKKDLFFKGLSVSLTANYNLGQEQIIDTVNKQYSWSGESIYKGTFPDKWSLGGERGRSLYKYRNNNGLVNFNASYTLNEQHSFVLNGMYSTFDRKGSDELMPQDENLKQPRKTQKSIFGLGYRFDASPRWNTTLFVKEYFQNNSSFQVKEKVYYAQKNSSKYTGYGFASTYFITPNLQLKGSYERSYRLPENEELFGDVDIVEPNFELKPESSDNINLGIAYNYKINEEHRLDFDGNFIYRFAKDFIRTFTSTIGVAQMRTVNLRDVINNGFDTEIRYTYKKLLTTGFNFTYQNIRNNTKYEGSSTTISPVYNDRMPNIPYLFGNANTSVFFSNVGSKGNTLSVGYNLLYVHAFYLRWPSQGDSALGKDDVPTQLGHDANIIYTLANGKYNLALEGRNLANNILYDNFSLQKPSRSFSLKVRYFLSNKFN
jgi:outer membrane receptor protein involved in Fe transport